MSEIEQRERKRESDRRYREANRERLVEYQRARYLREREKRAEYDRQRRLADPEGTRQRIRDWRLRHPEQARAQRRRWLDESPERKAAVQIALTSNARAKSYGAVGRVRYRDVLELWLRQPVCVDCGEGRGVDHVIPLSRGGSNTPDNLATRCLHCNLVKGVREVAA